MKTGPISNAGQFGGTPDSVVGERVIARHFAAGTGSPAVVPGPDVPGPDVPGPDVPGPDVPGLGDAVARTQGVDEVSKPLIGNGYAEYDATLSNPPDTQARASVRSHSGWAPGAASYGDSPSPAA